MALSQKQIREVQRDLLGVPIGKILCVVKAAMRLYLCWTQNKSDTCITQFIKDIEACLKGRRRATASR
jgi:hypothetical protein